MFRRALACGLMQAPRKARAGHGFDRRLRVCPAPKALAGEHFGIRPCDRQAATARRVYTQLQRQSADCCSRFHGKDGLGAATRIVIVTMDKGTGQRPWRY